MTEQSAIDLILREATDIDGILVAVRMGNDPGRERVAALMDALETLYTHRRGQAGLERHLAYALFGIAFRLQGLLQSETPSRSWSPELIGVEQFRIGLAVEGIFADCWDL